MNIKKVTSLPAGLSDWKNAEEIKITHWYTAKDKPLLQNPPDVRARALYSDTHIHILFTVTGERHIIAQYIHTQDSVCRDSCVEFFFAADHRAYINFEINCIGTYLCYRCTPVKQFDANPPGLSTADIIVKTSLPKGIAIPAPVISPSQGYTVQFSIPFSFISGVLDAPFPSAGTTWNANFYKCADLSPAPHWGSWSPITNGITDFHQPEFFSQIRFM